MRKVGRENVLVEHVGSAHTDAELAILLMKAREIVDGDQGVIEFDVPAPVVRVADVADWREGALLPAPRPETPAVAGRGRTLGTSSQLLYDVVGGVFDRLGFDTVRDRVFRDLVIARIVEPTSKLDSIRVLHDLGADPLSYKTIQRCLPRILTGDYRDLIATKCYGHAATTGGLSLVLYDVTTLYFEAEREDDLRKVGFSKERRVDPQIVVGLLVDRSGFPLEIGCFDGKMAETRTIVPIVKQFLARHELSESELVIAADAGMLSASNLKALDEAGLRFIVGSRSTKAPADLESHFHWNGTVFDDGQIVDTVTPRHANGKVNSIKSRTEPVWDPKKDTTAFRAIWQYSSTRARRDTITLDAQEQRAKEIVDGTRATKKTRFVRIDDGQNSLDQPTLDRARSLIGLKGYVTNVPVSTMPAAEVIHHYHQLWHVEQSFRMSKTDLRARPIFHHKRESIEAHLTIVFAALAVSRRIQEQTGLAIANVVKQLRPLRTSAVAFNGTTTYFPPQIPDAQSQILRDLGIEMGH